MANLTVDVAVKIQQMSEHLDLTLRQAEVLDMFIKTGGKVRESARQMDMSSKSSIQNHIDLILKKCQKKGFYPALGLNSVVPDGLDLDGKSVMWRNNKETGVAEPVVWWDKNSKEKQKEDLYNAFIEAFKASVKTPELPQSPIYTNDELITEYIITDFHLGMRAWAEEGGSDWNLGIAEKTIIDWFAHAIAKSEPSTNAVFAQLGDFLHYDGRIPETNASGHVLDTDCSFSQMVEVGLRIIKTVINMMLRKHQTVTVILAEGNHDENSSEILRSMFNIFYEENDRVIINRSRIPYYAMQFGDLSLYYHHGHKKPMKNLDVALTSIYPKIYGNTKHRYAACGHYHHSRKEETGLMTVEQYPTLAARDAYAARGGYVSGRSASVNTYHIKHGRITTHTITPEMLKEEVA